MNCLKDYIGLAGCGMDAPVSGRYINFLPGLPLESIDKMASQEKVNFAGVWSDVQDRTYSRMLMKLQQAMPNRMKSLSGSINLGRVVDVDTTTLSGRDFFGFKIQSGGASIFYSIYLQQVSFYSTESSGQFTIYVLDKFGNLLYKKSVTTGGVDWWNTIIIEQRFSQDTIYVLCGIDSAPQQLVSMEVPTATNQDFCDCIKKCCSECDDVAVSAVTYNDDDVFVEGENTFGLTGVFSMQCTYERLLCDNREYFADVWSYLLASELLVERKFSSRLNFWKINTEETESLIKYYDQRFEEALEMAVRGITLDMSDCCIECQAPMQVVEFRA